MTMGRPPKLAANAVVSVRLNEEQQRLIDTYAKFRDQPSRSDAIRTLIQNMGTWLEKEIAKRHKQPAMPIPTAKTEDAEDAEEERPYEQQPTADKPKTYSYFKPQSQTLGSESREMTEEEFNRMHSDERPNRSIAFDVD